MRAKSLLRCLGEELRHRRTSFGISQEALAHQAGVHTNVVGRLERGGYNPTVLVLHSLATQLDISMSKLFECAEERQKG
jgi:transcriptional regulator with XRE-family HTH domain